MSIDNVEDLPARVQYVAAAAQTDFDYPFPIFTNADLIVDVDGVTKVLTTNYTMTGAGNDTGGTVTFGTPMSGGEIVTLYRQIAIERLTDIQQNGPWSSTAYNDEQDKTYLLLQQLNDRCNLALRLPATVESDTDSLELDPSNFASKYLAFDANGRPEPAVLSDTTMTASIVRALLDAATNISHTSAEPRVYLKETGAGTDRGVWDIDIDGHILSIRTRTDADGVGKNIIKVTRGLSTAVSSVEYGDSADLVLHTFNGTIYHSGALGSGSFKPHVGNAAYKAANTSRSSSVALTDDADLQVLLESSAVYHIEIGLNFYEASAGAAGISLETVYTGTGGAINTTLFYDGKVNGSASAGDFVVGTPLSFSNVGATASRLVAHGVYDTTTSGTFKLKWCQYSSSGNATTLAAGSYILVTKIG